MYNATRSRGTLTHARRGNIIIFVVAVLAIISISAASYVTITSLGRSSAASYQDRRNPLLQRDVVIDHIGDLLAADLFGNKVVTVATPFQTGVGNGNALVQPRPFEDGEFADVPYTVTYSGNSYPNDASVFFTYDTRPLDPNGSPVTLATETDPFTLHSSALGRPDNLIGGQQQDLLFHAGFADDAWLASTEPVDDNAVTDLGPGYWDTWPQITNLLSAYYWDQSADTGRGLWVRDTGRFVDIGNFFLSDSSENLDRGDPGAVMTNLSAEIAPTLGTYTPDAHTDPLHMARHPALGRLQPVFQYQLHQMSEYLDPGQSNSASFIEQTPDSNPPVLFTHSDTRMWMDTDGDMRPDARWQELDAFNNLFGWRWFVAARIVDASAMVNANTSLGPGDPSLSAEYATGITPADIDIYRLLDGGAFIQNTNPAFWSMVNHPDLQLTNNNAPRNNWATHSARNHVQRGLRVHNYLTNALPTVLGGMSTALSSPDRNAMVDFGREYNARTGAPVTPGGDILRQPTDTPYPSFLPLQREAFYRLAASDTHEPNTPNVRFYRDESEIDLRSFWGYSTDSGTAPIEAAFDSTFTNVASADRRPRADIRYADTGFVLGLLRSREEANEVIKFEKDPGNMSWLTSDYTQAEKISRIMGDTRRHLTTFSGEAPRSPLPISVASTLSARRLEVNDIENTPTQEYVENAFSSFMWALAPLAADHAILPGLIPNNRRNNYPYNTHEAHYGGNDDPLFSPAAQWLKDFPDDLQTELGYTPGLTDDAGVAFAMHKALSLSVNLRDAVDNFGGSVSTPNPLIHTLERPTVARLFLNKTVIPDDTSPERVARVELTTELAHGKINAEEQGIMAAAGGIQNALFGNYGSGRGISVVGMEPQPFLVEAVSMALYEEVSNVLPAELGSDDIVGFMFAIELGNPWPFDIDASGYVIEIEDLGEIPLADFVAPIDVTGSGASFDQNAVITAENTKIFFIVSDYDDTFSTSSNEFFNILIEEIQTRAGASTIALLDEGAATFDTGPGQLPIPWNAGSMSSQVMLWRELQVEDPAPSYRPAVPRVLVDRLGTDPIEFPAGFDSGDWPLATGSPIGSSEARLAIGGALKRSDEPVNLDGYPQYVFENPGWNHNTVQMPAGSVDDADPNWQVALLNALDSPTDLASDVINADGPGEFEWTLGEWNANPNGNYTSFGGGAAEAPFQLFLPDGPLLTRSELLRLSPYAHTYFHQSSIDEMLVADRWWTFSEQIGSPHAFLHSDYNNPGAPMSPYAGLLDPTRFVLGTFDPLNGTGADLAFDRFPNNYGDAHVEANRFDQQVTLTDMFRGPLNHFAVPLALRVVDALEVLGTNGDLAHGKININTAGEPVLRVLPHVDPAENYNSFYTQFGPNPPAPFALFTNKDEGERRVRMIQSYRDPLMANLMVMNDPPSRAIDWRWDFPLSDAMAAPHELLGGQAGAPTIRGIRGGQESGVRTLPLTKLHQTHGFSSLGELAILGRWKAASPIPEPEDTLVPNAPGFLDGATDLGNQRDEIFELRRPGGYIPTFEPVDDAHERMLLFQAISNIVTTRSDVYVAWFVIRAYSPADIESVDIESSITSPIERVTRGMDGGIDQITGEFVPGLSTRHESRWLVVFDRSNVKNPTDRPQVVLTAKLPVVSP
ncbi:MAG: hypothetical protein ACF8GE_12325 [Phycisphaerales bacterium JB043]